MKKGLKEKFNQNKKNMEFYNQDGTNKPKKKGNYKPKYKKEKIKPIYLTYTPELTEEEDGEVAFGIVLGSISQNCQVADSFLQKLGEIESFDDYVAKASAEIVKTPPQLLAKKNIHTCYSVSANRVHIRLEGDVAFTIEVKYQIVKKAAQITNCTGTIILYAKNDELYNTLIENGWTEYTK